MFGLMRPPKCCSTSKTATYKTHRMHYCGTCKTIGNQYGHASRLFLNYDIVFLSELLSELHSEDLTQWQTNYHAINKCSKMPKKGTTIPFSLSYAATANVVLAALKIDDHIKDLKQWKWKLTRFFYRRKFHRAFQHIDEAGIPKNEIWKWIEAQGNRELQTSPTFQSLDAYLNFVAEPTAQITSLIFENGTPNQSTEVQELLKSIGFQFGQLNYILDAFEDLEQDIFKQQFNPLQQWFKPQFSLQTKELEQVRQLLLRLQESIGQQLQQLPIDNAQSFIARLESNLALRLYKKRIIPQSYQERLQNRMDAAKEFASKILCNQEAWFAPIQYFLISFSVFLVPSIAMRMDNYKEPVQWKWNVFFATILPFSNSDELLDTPIKEEAPPAKKSNSLFCDCACFECFSACGDCACCATESSAGSCECCSILEGCGSCCEGTAGCCEGCGACADCCGACAV